MKADLQAKAKLRDVSHMKVIEYENGKHKAVRKLPHTLFLRSPPVHIHALSCIDNRL